MQGFEKHLSDRSYVIYKSLYGYLPTITNYVYLNYQGAIAGSEFLIYAATKYYLALNLVVHGGSGFNVGNQYVGVYDKNNAFNARLSNQAGYWDGAAAQLMANPIMMTDFHFSRLEVTSYYPSIQFVGYRITY